MIKEIMDLDELEKLYQTRDICHYPVYYIEESCKGCRLFEICLLRKERNTRKKRNKTEDES